MMKKVTKKSSPESSAVNYVFDAKRKELAKAQTAFLFLRHLLTIDTRLPDSMTVLEIYNILCFTNYSFYSKIVPKLIIEFPNLVENKLWALAVSDNLYSYENEKYVDLKYRCKSGFWI